MGNKKRSAVLTPIVLKDFAGKKIVGVFAGDNKSGVIIEREEEPVKEKKWFSHEYERKRWIIRNRLINVYFICCQ